MAVPKTESGVGAEALFHDLFKKLLDGKVEEFFELFDNSSVKDKISACQKEHDDKGSFIHLVCGFGDHDKAAETAEQILERIRYQAGPEVLFDVVNKRRLKSEKPGGNGETPLEIAISARNKPLIEKLLEYSADADYALSGEIEPLDKIYGSLHSVMIKLFDKHFRVNTDKYDPENELLWTIDYDFSPIVGIESRLDRRKYKDTDRLVKVLPIKRHKRNDILTHPLTRIFLAEKRMKLRWWIWISILVHMLFYAMSVIYLTSSAQKYLSANVGTRDESGSSIPEMPNAILLTAQILGGPYFYSMYFILYIGFLGKEVFELRFAPCKTYYIKQFENLGQWILFLMIAGATGFRWKPDSALAPTFCCTAGILVSLLLVQGQLTKTRLCGVYNIMLQKAIMRFGLFLVSYIPLLLAFAINFNLLFHQEKKEFSGVFPVSGKVLAMFVGEFDYKEVFLSDSVIPYHRLIPGILLFIMFVIAVAILLQNILVALTVDDIKELKSKCLVSRLAGELELIHILEPFVDTCQAVWIEMIRKISARHFLTVSSTDTESIIPSADNSFQNFSLELQKCIKKYHDDKKLVESLNAMYAQT